MLPGVGGPGPQDMGAALARLRGLTDPAERAAAATALLEQLAGVERDVSGIRDEAVRVLRAGGASYGRIAASSGLTRSRVVQLLQRGEDDGDAAAAEQSAGPSTA